MGFDSADDAAVYRLTDEIALIQTLDFFPSMVSDPYLFGKIAATNALSDVWAMGGRVLTAMNIVAFPETQDLKILGEILRGGAEKVQESGGVLCGGHSIHDTPAKYGLSVTGIVHPDHVLSNNGVEEGDLLVLTKPIGTGLVATAWSVGETTEDAFLETIRSMTTLNRYASEVITKGHPHACTDVTGFGLAGHLHEMLAGRFSAELYRDRIPVLPDAERCASEFLSTKGGQKNRNFMTEFVTFEKEDFVGEEIIYDSQTSGGLLYAMSEETWEAVKDEAAGLDFPAVVIGRVLKRNDDPKREIVVKQSAEGLS